MVAKDSKRLVVVGDEMDKPFGRGDDFLGPGQRANVLEKQVQTVSCAWSPRDVLEVPLHYAACSLAVSSVVADNLHHVLWSHLAKTKMQCP